MFMKNHILFCAAVLSGLFCLTGCASDPDFTPPDGYAMKSRNLSDVNLYFILHTNNVLTAAQTAEMREAVEHYFRKSKRFHIWWQKDSAVEEDVVVNVHFEIMSVRGSSHSGMGAKVTLSAMNNHHSGLGGDSLLVQGFSRPEQAKNRFAAPMNFSVGKHFTEALNEALRKLQRDIEKLYPISSKVKSFQCDNKGRAEFTIPIGTNYGLSRRYEYLVCCSNQNGYSVIGVANGAPGAEFTQLRIVKWNRDSFNFDDIYQRIRQNDRSLADKLFVVARVKK